MEEISGDSSAGSKSIKSQDNEDRLSTLPDSLIQLILSLLPSTTEAIRTVILSKRWQALWTHISVSGDADNGFIENTLLLHDSPKIKQFNLYFDSESDTHLTSKIQFAIKKCVEELILTGNPYYDISYLLPRFLFDNALFVRLEMISCHFMRDWTVNWPYLKSLKIDCRNLSINDNCSQGIGNVVLGSPLLESLEFRGELGDHDAIVSNSLKTLSFVDVEVPDTFKISCPNLVEFHADVDDLWPESVFPNQMIENVLSGSPFIHSLKLANCAGFDSLVISSKCLKVLSLEFFLETSRNFKIEVSCPNLEKLDILCSDDEFHTVNLSSSTCAAFNYVYPWNHNDSVRKMLEQFQDVNKLTIGSSFFWIISDFNVEVRLLLPSLNRKCLTLNVGGNFGFALPGIAYALRSPVLERLVIKLNSKSRQCKLEQDLQDSMLSIMDHWNSNGSDGLTCLVSHLKVVKIIGLYKEDGKCKLVLKFIEFLLKNAMVLEKMVVSLKKPGKSFGTEVAHKLLSFTRCSGHASVELVYSA